MYTIGTVKLYLFISKAEKLYISTVGAVEVHVSTVVITKQHTRMSPCVSS
jgi:hypothetical protein